jgi:hypothetical protein
MDGVVSAHVGCEETVVGRDSDLHAAVPSARKVAVQVCIDDEHIWLVDGDEPVQWTLPVDFDQSAIDVGNGGGNELLEEGWRAVIQPYVQPQPGRMCKVLERDDGFETMTATRSQPIGIAVQSSQVEGRRRRRGRGRSRGLNTGPLDAQSEGIKTYRLAVSKILFVAVPKVCGRSCAHDDAARFESRPIVLGLVGAIVAAFALVAGAGHTPEKFFIHGRKAWKSLEWAFSWDRFPRFAWRCMTRSFD